MSTIEFNAGDREFRVKPLDPETALRLLGILSEHLLPAVGDGIGFVTAQAAGMPADEGAFFGSLAKAVKSLPEVYRTFLGVSEVKIQAGWVPLKDFERATFERRATLILAWLSACLHSEYADFFGEAGREALKETGNRWISLIGSIGGSGESSPTEELESP